MPAEKALVNYIRDALAAGAALQQIRDQLRAQDWPDASIDQAMAEAAQPRQAAAPRAPALPLNPIPGQPFQPFPQPRLIKGAPHGFALAFAGGLAVLLRSVGGSFTGLPNPFGPALAPAALLIGFLFAALILVSSILLKKGKFMAGIIAIALSAVLILFSADLTLTAPALLAAVGGALGLAKR